MPIPKKDDVVFLSGRHDYTERGLAFNNTIIGIVRSYDDEKEKLVISRVYRFGDVFMSWETFFKVKQDQINILATPKEVLEKCFKFSNNTHSD